MGRERIDSVRVRLFEYGNHVVTVYLIKYDCIYYFIIKTEKSLFIWGHIFNLTSFSLTYLIN